MLSQKFLRLPCLPIPAPKHTCSSFRAATQFLDLVLISGHVFNVSVPTGLFHIVQYRDAGITADISRKLTIPLFIHLLLNQPVSQRLRDDFIRLGFCVRLGNLGLILNLLRFVIALGHKGLSNCSNGNIKIPSS